MTTLPEDGYPMAAPPSPAAAASEEGPRGEPAGEGASCRRCGYRLTGLLDTGACPECGMSVFDSMRGHELRWSSPDYVRTLHRGIVCILVGSILTVLLGLFGGIVGGGFGFAAAFAAGRAAPAPVAPAAPAATLPADAPAPPPPDAAAEPPIDAEPTLTTVPADGSTTPAAAPPAATAPPAANWRTTFAPGGSLASTMRLLVAISAFASAAVEVLVLVGWWLFSSRDPALSEGDRGEIPRRVIRAVVVIVAVTTLINLSLTGSITSAVGFSPGVVGAIGVSMLAGLAQIARFFAAMSYLRWMAPRLPDPFVDERAKLYTWLLPVIYVLGSCVLIGPLVATVMQWLLLNRVRRDLGQVLDRMTGDPEALPGIGPAA